MPIIINNPKKPPSERVNVWPTVKKEIKKRAVAEYGKVYTGDPFITFMQPEWFD